MKPSLTDKLVGYHYSNEKAYDSMKTKGIDGYISFDYEHFAGLIPRRRFIKLGEGKGLPDEAYDGVIEGLLEPEPRSWLENPEFPNLWGYLMHDVCRREKVMLLSFELRPDDKAFVVDRAHVEREYYRESKGLGKPTKETRSEAFRKYFESRVAALEYKGNYSLPQLAIWSGIPFDRLKVEWIKPTDEAWQRILDNNW
jgi:hypothetical protein